MTKNEAVLISAYTGILLTKSVADVHKFCEELLGRPIFTHEFSDKKVWERIHEKCHPLILEMVENETQ